MAASEENIWEKLAELPGSFPENGEDVKSILRDYYLKIENKSTKTKSSKSDKKIPTKSDATTFTASQFPNGLTLDKRIELLAMVVYCDMHIDVPKTSGIYRDHYELSKKVLQSPKFWEGVTKEDRKKEIVAIFSRALVGKDNSALKAMKEDYEKGENTDLEDYKFIYFCAGIRHLFLRLLFVDERAAAEKFPNWSNMSESAQSSILTSLPRPILTNVECEKVIAELIPVLYPGKTAEDYSLAIEISSLQKSNRDVADSKGKEKVVTEISEKKKENPFLNVKDPKIRFKTDKRATKLEEKDNPREVDVQTPLISSEKDLLIKPKTVRRQTKREAEDKSQKAEIQNSSTKNKLKVGFMGGLVTLGLGIGLLFVPGLQAIGIGLIVVGTSVAAKTAYDYSEEDKKAKMQQPSREDKGANEGYHRRSRNDREKKIAEYALGNIVSDNERKSERSSLEDSGSDSSSSSFSLNSSATVSPSSFWGKRYGTTESPPLSPTPKNEHKQTGP